MLKMLTWVVLWSLFPGWAMGQKPARAEKMLVKARQAYEKSDYSRAISLAGRISGSSPSGRQALLLLSDVYHDMDSTAAEIRCLESLAEENPEPLVFYRLGESYYKGGAYEKGLEAVNRYLVAVPQGNLRTKALRLREHCAFSAQAMTNPVPFTPRNVGKQVNSPWDDYWPSLTVDGSMMVITRLLPSGEHTRIKQEDFFGAMRDSSGWTTALPLTELNTSANEGAQSVSADGKLLFYTLCNDPGGFGSCDIYFSRRADGGWTTPRNAGAAINTPGWEGQPSLSAFGDILYFSSSRAGGKGNKDLWSAALTGWSTEGIPLWGTPTPLGDSINTPGDEISPFIHANGKDLYFCSDYRPGLGGFDIFHTRKKTTGNWQKAENLGFPVNSSGNEQGLIIDRTGETAYFSSNRDTPGNMDIYAFEVDDSFRPEAVTYIHGRVVNHDTGEPLSARVQLIIPGNDLPLAIEAESDKNGEFLLTIPREENITCTVNKQGFLFYNETFDISEAASALHPVERLISLVPVKPGNSIDLYNIFFETYEFAILPESEPELQTLLGFLKENPSLKVEIGGHTDNTGTAEFNLRLSGKRAASVQQYLLERGIAATRLFPEGYGMEQPVAPNDTEEGKSKNRRTTIKIIELR